MAFANEVKDFIAAFQVGATIKDRKQQRAIQEKAEDNRIDIAKMKDARDTKRFDAELGIKTRAQDRADEILRFNRARFADDSGLRKNRLALDTKKHEDTMGRLRDSDARKAKKEALEEDPTRIIDEEEAPAQALPTGVTPSEPAQDRAQAIPISNEEKAGAPQASGLGMGPVTPAVALAGGLKYMQEEFGLAGKQEAVPTSGGSKSGAKRLFEGEGSMTPEEQSAVDKLLDEDDIKRGVDPQKLTDGMRSVRRLTRTYEKLLERGKTKEANQMAAAIIQSSRGVASMLGTQAIIKLQRGDANGAAADLISAYDQIPDGRSVEFNPQSGAFRIKDDESGDLIQEGQVTPDMIFSLANGFKDGSAFYKIVADAASRDPSMQNKETAASKAAAKPEELKPVDTYAAPDEQEGGTVKESIGAELLRMTLPDGTPVVEGTDPQALVDAIGEQSLDAINDLGELITKYNEVRPEIAGRLAMSIVNPNLEGEDPFNFKLIRDDPNTMEIVTEDGTRLRLPARVAAAMIKKGHQGLSQFAARIQQESNARGAGPARQSRTGEIESDNARGMQRAANEEATAAFDRDVVESIHGPGGDEAQTLASQQKPPKFRKRLAGGPR